MTIYATGYETRIPAELSCQFSTSILDRILDRGEHFAGFTIAYEDELDGDDSVSDAILAACRCVDIEVQVDEDGDLVIS